MESRQVFKSKVCAIIVAAGESRRMNGTDKLMALLAGKPVLVWSIEAFQKSPRISRIILVNSQKNLEQVECMRIENAWTKVAEVCTGGQRRQDSVAAGLKLVGDCDWVIIHDGARPLITQDLIEKGLEAARETGAAIAAVPVIDTIKLAGSDMIVIETPPRSNLWAVQTPQVFRFALIKEAYGQSKGDFTDDAALVEQTGSKVKLFQGSYDNIKITAHQDLALAELLIKEYDK
jgi:2-C-methyl-D-erythritol 4-phosphate cytidylyltransferase